MDAGRQRAMVRKSTAARLKQQREASTSAPKATLPPKAAPKRKGVGKDNCPAKKATGQPAEANRKDQPQKSPPPPCHGLVRALCQPMVPSSSASSRD